MAETHEEFIICDDIFCALGNFNWLSYRGERDGRIPAREELVFGETERHRPLEG